MMTKKLIETIKSLEKRLKVLELIESKRKKAEKGYVESLYKIMDKRKNGK